MSESGARPAHVPIVDYGAVPPVQADRQEGRGDSRGAARTAPVTPDPVVGAVQRVTAPDDPVRVAMNGKW